jgi:hypothetical protein
LQIGNIFSHFGGKTTCFSESLAVKLRQPHKPIATPLSDLPGCVIGRKEAILTKLVKRYQRRKPSRDAGVAG